MIRLLRKSLQESSRAKETAGFTEGKARFPLGKSGGFRMRFAARPGAAARDPSVGAQGGRPPRFRELGAEEAPKKLADNQ